MYNTDSMTEADMPASILDFAEPEWKGRVSFSPTGADFQAIVSAVLELEGEAATQEWLAGLKDNGVIVQNNLVVMQSVDSGEVDAGIAYHYYWYRDRAENGTDSDNSELHFFGDQDPGAFLSISGAGILASSENAEAAEEFVTWLTSTEAQQAMAESYALEYPLNPEASLNPDVKPFDELEPPSGRRVQPQRPPGHRADDPGRSALTGTGRRTSPLLLAAGAVVALLALVPLVYVAASIVIIGPAELWELLARPRIGELLRNTVTLAIACMATTAVLGVALAVLVERTDLPVRRLWHGLLVAPLAVPAFVNGYAWVSLDRSVNGFTGALLVVTLSYYPLVYLPVVAVLRRLDPALEESAWSLGHSRAHSFRSVVLPQLRPALLGGALLVGLHLLAEFGALVAAALPDLHDRDLRPVRLDLQRVRRHGDGRRAGPALPLPAPRRAPPARQPALRPARTRCGPCVRPGHPRARSVAARRRRGRGRRARRRRTRLLPRAVAGGRHLDGVPARRARLGPGLDRRAGRSPARSSPRWPRCRWCGWPYATAAGPRRSIERSTYVANALPGIVVGLALVVASLRLVPAIYQTALLLVVAYAILFLPRAVVTVRAGLEQAPVVLDDVAQSLGAGPLQTARRVTLPLIAPSLGAGAALVFLAISTELTATLMLSPIGTRTLATEFWSASSELRYGAASPYALLLVLVSIPATVLLMRQERLPA